MVVVRPMDFLNQCYTAEDGAQLFKRIAPLIRKRQNVAVSFERVDSVPSSFVNAAFIRLLDEMPFSQIKEHLRIVNSTRQINEMIRDRFEFEEQRKQG